MIGFISDIHGNFPALQAVIEAIDKVGCDKVICLGDIVGYYCMPNECIDLLRNRNVFSLLGNHDYYMITNTCCNSKTVKMCIDYQRQVLFPENIAWLKSLTPIYNDELMSLRHGGWNNAIEERFNSFDFELVKGMPQRYYLSGHTHLQYLEYSNKFTNKIYCNPGSVGQPRDGNPKAAFAILRDNGNMELHRVEYDIDSIVLKMKECNQGDWIWKNLYTGKKIGD